MSQTRRLPHDSPRPRTQRAVAPAPTALLIGVLALLSTVSPLATDMYLPAFPQIASDLGTPASGVQLTLTAFMVGLAAGQLVIGPMSDALGRRGPLLVGTVVCLVASIVCALAPGITVFVLARFVQGFSGAAGMVIARAVVTDVTTGATTAKLMNVMMVVGSIMPVLAPVLGGGILQLAHWRVIFWVIAAMVVLMILGILFVTGESLPPQRRHAGGLRKVAANTGTVLRNRTYVSAALVLVLAFTTLFAYVSASPFVVQNVLGMSTLQYSTLFAVNALGITAGSMISIRLAGRVAVHRTLGAGVVGLLSASLWLLVVVLAEASAVPVLLGMFTATLSVGLIMGNASSLAMRAAATTAGTGSAFMGAVQFLLGAAVSPVVGIAGEADARPMAITMAVCAAAAGAAYVALVRELRRIERDVEG
ncbi:multidrug effflux MFS transporter [Brachybacterium sp. P6-10-X1]|uniref:multidrug effflux MFS transporter n=1 Tax=Brachybacterium sp. P6-10-X1 TaxID=1903186 RepID=UPI0009F8D980|nr:multidrug effflux MFS transporter [Brachybacterium sp. P6-10-X1]